MDAKLSIKKFKDPNKGNWDVNITGQYLNVVGKIYDFKQYKEADKIKDANGNLTNCSYFKAIFKIKVNEIPKVTISSDIPTTNCSRTVFHIG